MRILIFGATGMLGQGTLRECLLDDAVSEVIVVGRTAAGQHHEKLRDIVHKDLMDLSPIENDVAGLDACFFCLGVSAVGMSEAEYRRITYDLTLSIARALVALTPELTFIYVSGAGTDSTEQGRSMWARVKGATENALLELTPNAYMLRPGYIQPMHGATSKTGLYKVAYAVVAPIFPILQRIAPNSLTTTELVGKAMLDIARSGAPKRVLGPREINAAAGT